MIRIIIYMSIVITVSFGFNYDLKPKKLTKNVWCFFGSLDVPNKSNGGNMSNSCYIRTKNSYILVDAGPTYIFAHQAYQAMSKIEKLPVSIVINTHDHDDHWLGSGFYKKTFNAKLIGPSSINKNYKVGDKTRMLQLLTKDAIGDTKIVNVDEEVSSIKTINKGKVNILIIPVGTKAHSSEDLFVYFKNEKVLFSGDLVMNGRITSNRDGSVIGQIKALDMIDKKDWNVLVPGHGFDTGKTAMVETKKYFKLLKKQVLKAIEDDISVDEVTSVVKLEDFKERKLYKELNGRNVFEAFSELEFYEKK